MSSNIDRSLHMASECVGTLADVQEYILRFLLDELVKYESTGIASYRSREIRAKLEAAVNAACRIPDGVLGARKLWQYHQAVADTFRDWDDVRGASSDAAHRRNRLLVKLRKQSQQISFRMRTLEFVFESGLDLTRIEKSLTSSTFSADSIPAMAKCIWAAVTHLIPMWGK